MNCKNCGNPLREGDQFCPNCGAAAEPPKTQAEEQKNENVCKNCGKPLQEGTMFCPYCGASVANGQAPSQAAWQPWAPPQPSQCAAPYAQGAPAPRADDAPSGGFFALGFFFPLIGLILFLVWKDQLPKRAKSCGKGALVGVIVQFVFWLILVIVAGVIGASQYAGAAIAGLALYL